VSIFRVTVHAWILLLVLHEGKKKESLAATDKLIRKTT
jgi:hypothetical protein